MSLKAAQLRHVVPENALRMTGHPEHSHTEPHLIHVVMGTAHLLVDGDPVVLHARESLWLAPGVPHAAHYDAGSLVLGPMLSPATQPLSRVQPLGVVPAVTEIMLAILGAAPTTAEEVSHFRRALDAALQDLGADHFALVMPTHPKAAAVARQARFSPETVAELAARHGYSARQLQRIFLAETGLAFHRWRVRARLNVALAKLRGGASTLQAAKAAGYATHSGLLKALRREVDHATLAELGLAPASLPRETMGP